MWGESFLILEGRDLDVYIGGSHILQGISFEIRPEVTTAVLGRNGAGKTTLARAVMGLMGKFPANSLMFRPASTGTLDKVLDLSVHEPEYRVSCGIAYVPQGRRLFPSLTVEENIYVGGYAAAKTGRNHYWSIDDIYEVFPRLYERRYVSASVLSGGEQQMLAIARAINASPCCLIFDEPTEGLSPKMIETVLEIIKRVMSRGVTVFLFEQNVDFISELASDIILLQSGQVFGVDRDLERDDMQRIGREFIAL